MEDNYGIPDAKNKSFDLGETEYQHTLENMYNIAYMCAYQTQELANHLEAESIEQTCKNIFYFIRENIKYEQEKGELLREPARSWQDRHEGVDCDCYSIFISSILINLNIPHFFRCTSYSEIGEFEHVYVVVENESGEEIPLDTVPEIKKFGYEEPYIDKEDFEVLLNMNTKRLNGLDQNSTLEEKVKALSDLLGVEITLEQEVQSIGFAQTVAISALEAVKEKLESSDYQNNVTLAKEYELVKNCLDNQNDLEYFMKYLKEAYEQSEFFELYNYLIQMIVASTKQEEYTSVRNLLSGDGSLSGFGFLPFLAPIGDAVSGVINAIDNIGGGARNRARDAAEAAQRQAEIALKAEQEKTTRTKLETEAKIAEAQIQAQLAQSRDAASRSAGLKTAEDKPEDKPKEEKSWFEKNWYWLAGGVVVLIIFGGLFFYFSKKKPKLNGVRRRKAARTKRKITTPKRKAVAGMKRRKITPRKVGNVKKVAARKKAKNKNKKNKK